MLDSSPTSVLSCVHIRGTQAHLKKPFSPIVAPRKSAANVLRGPRVSRANFRGAAPWQDHLLHEPFHELEAVAQRHLAHPGNLCDRLLRPAFAGGQRGEVDRRRGGPRRREGHRAIDLLQFLQDLVGLGFDGVAEAQTGTKAAHVVRRPGRRDAERQAPKQGPVRLADRLLADPGDLLQLIEGPRHAIDPAGRVDGGRDDRLDGPSANESLLQGLPADEPGLVLHRSGQAHRGGDPVQGSNRLGQASLARARVAGMPLELPHPVKLLSFPQRDRVPAGVLVRERDDGREARGTRHIAARGARAREPIVLLDRVRRPFRALVDRTLADHETARIADKLAARVVAHEVLTATFRTDSVFFDDRIVRRRGRHGDSSFYPRWATCSPNITSLYYTLSPRSVTSW